MIDIPKVRVLRYTIDELRRMRHKAGPNLETVDWFTTTIEKQYPKWHVVTTLRDWSSDYVYVIMTKERFTTKQTMKSKNGVAWVEEELVAMV